MKKYSFVFWCGYVSNEDGKPSIQHVTEKDITEDNGFFDEYHYGDDVVKDLKEMAVGEKYNVDEMMQDIEILRYE